MDKMPTPLNRSTSSTEIKEGAPLLTKLSKGSALQFLAKQLNVPKEAIAAFGNDDNDLSLRPYAGRFIVPRDASPAALAAADQVVESILAAALGLCISSEGKEAKRSW